jgi:hypothetical protein
VFPASVSDSGALRGHLAAGPGWVCAGLEVGVRAREAAGAAGPDVGLSPHRSLSKSTTARIGSPIVFAFGASSGGKSSPKSAWQERSCGRIRPITARSSSQRGRASWVGPCRSLPW